MNMMAKLSIVVPHLFLSQINEKSVGHITVDFKYIDDWMDMSANVDFDKSERYLYEFLNHKDYYSYRKRYFKYMEQYEIDKKLVQTKPVSL